MKAKPLQITDLKSQTFDSDRVNVFIDGKFQFGLRLEQVVEFKLKIGQTINSEQLEQLQRASHFGVMYQRALKYCLLRPRSTREVHDYLWRIAQPKQLKSGRQTSGYPLELIDSVIVRLTKKDYLNDQQFAQWWASNRRLRTGISKRKLRLELIKKGLAQELIEQVLLETGRNDSSELQKLITKKAKRYSDPTKLTRYLVGQGFSYEEVRLACQNLELN